MYANCIAPVTAVPDGVRDLDTLKIWLVKGTWPRFVIIYPTKDITWKVCNSPDEVPEHAIPGCKIVTLHKFERNTQELVTWVQRALKRKDYVSC